MLAAVKGIVQGDTVQADVACKLSHGIQVLLSFGVSMLLFWCTHQNEKE